MLAPFLATLVGMAVVMGLAWLFQRIVRNGGWIDVFWTFGTGAMCVLAALWPAPAANESRQLLVALLAAIWALRLGVYLGHRVATGPEDTRYAEFRKEWGGHFHRNMAILAMPQAPATAILSLSVFVAAHGGAPELGVRDLLGVAILVIAIVGEGIADEQMRQFKREGHRGAIMDRGLWAWSRHPNYFFEWVGWLAYPIIAFDPTQLWTWATWIAPIVMFILLRFFTGVPATERSMLASRGDKFRDYQRRVSAFFLLPPKGKSP